MENEVVHISPECIEIIDASEYSEDLTKHFSDMPDVARPLVKVAKEAFSKIEQMLYSAPAFINLVKASVPEQTFQAILTDDQKEKLASGSLKLMTKKDGSLVANLVNPETNKIVSTISLQNVNLSPALSQAMTSYASQMQMAQIAEQIQVVQLAIEEVRQGQEYDRLAMAYSCQQKLLQAMEIRNPKLKAMALLQIASDAEDSRNLLMQSQNANLSFFAHFSHYPQTFAHAQASTLLWIYSISPIFRASKSNSSRKLGWAMEIRALARCENVLPRSLAMPYSVTIMSTSFRPVVTPAPGARKGLILLIVPPLAVDGNAIKLNPPRLINAPRT